MNAEKLLEFYRYQEKFYSSKIEETRAIAKDAHTAVVKRGWEVLIQHWERMHTNAQAQICALEKQIEDQRHSRQ